MPLYTDYFNGQLLVYGRQTDDVITSPGHGFGIGDCLQIKAAISMKRLIYIVINRSKICIGSTYCNIRITDKLGVIR